MKTNKEKWIFTAILAVIEVFLTAAELGFFTIGKIAFTILHIPVFITVIEIGLLQGFILAAIFGFSSLVSAYLHANGILDYLFQDPRISVLPRLLIPLAVWLIYRAVRNIADDNTLSADLICSGFAAMSGVAANAVFVITAIAVLSPEALGITDDLSASTVIVSNLVVSAAGAGTLEGAFSFAETGTLEVQDLPEEFPVTLPGTYSGCSGFANIANWSVTCGGKAARLSINIIDGKIVISKLGMHIIIK
jgi:uncharacterized membrane protein